MSTCLGLGIETLNSFANVLLLVLCDMYMQPSWSPSSVEYMEFNSSPYVSICVNLYV